MFFSVWREYMDIAEKENNFIVKINVRFIFKILTSIASYGVFVDYYKVESWYMGFTRKKIHLFLNFIFLWFVLALSTKKKNKSPKALISMENKIDT